MKQLQKTIILLITFYLSFAGCSSSVKNEKAPASGTDNRYYETLDYDNYGLPLFRKPLKKKPSEAGENYFVVQERNGLPETFANVGIIEPEDKPSLKNIYMVVYRWTGKGFETGYKNTKGMIEQSGDFASSGIEPFISTVIATPFMLAGGVVIVACGAGGFVVGLAETIPATIDEVKKLGLDNYEIMLSVTKLDYDRSGRLVKSSTYASSDESSLLFETVYHYKGNSVKPSKTVSFSRPDKKERVIYNSK